MLCCVCACIYAHACGLEMNEVTVFDEQHARALSRLLQLTFRKTMVLYVYVTIYECTQSLIDWQLPNKNRI